MVDLSIVMLNYQRVYICNIQKTFKIRAWRECRVKFLEVAPTVSDLLVINGDLTMVNDD